MIIYGSPLSPFVRKTLAVVTEKGLTAELKPVFPGSKDAEFRQASPFGKIPGFTDGDFAISDSTAIITYLEAKYPDPALLPADPADRARAIWFEEFSDTILGAAVGKIFFNRIVAPMMGQPGDLAAADAAERNELPPLFDYLERVLPTSGFLVADKLTLADLAVASPFVNFAHANVRPDPATYPKTVSFLARLHGRASFAQRIAQEKALLGG